MQEGDDEDVLGVTLGDRVGSGGDEGIVVGDVGGQATDTGVRTSLLEQATEELSGRSLCCAKQVSIRIQMMKAKRREGSGEEGACP